MTKRRFITTRIISGYALIMFSLLVATSCLGQEHKNLPKPYRTTPAYERQLHTYDAFWDGIREKYLYAEDTNFDTDTLRFQTRRKIEEGMTNSEFEDLMRSMLETFPSNTVTYRTRSERIDEDLSNTLSYEGIGAYITVQTEPQPHVILLAVMSDSPAEKAGLRTHDSIYAIDGQPVTAKEGLKVVKRVRGPAGSVVMLDVQSPNGSKRNVKVIRGRVTASDELRWGMMGISKTGVIRLPIAAGNDLDGQMIGALQELAKQEISNLIIDMRIAHSGPSWPLEGMLSLFDDGHMGTMQSRVSSQPLTVSGNNVLNSQLLPLLLLIGPDTQGASEMFAASLQASGRAVLIGLPTPGRVMGFDQFVLPDGSEVFYATSSYHTPDGEDLAIIGVHPDILVDAGWDEVDDDRDPVISRALLQLTQ